MFKELKILKLSLFAIFLIVIIWRVSESNKFSLYYLNQPSYGVEDEISLFQAGNYVSKNASLKITSLNGEEIFSGEFDLENNINKNIRSQNFPFSNVSKLKLANDVGPGIYAINNEYSLILRNNKNSEVTIVYPYINNMIYERVKDSCLLTLEATTFNKAKPVKIDDFTKGLRRMLKYCDDTFSTNYIADLDLENEELFNSTQLLIIYGQTSFYTDKMKNNVINFIKKGGNVLLMTSTFANNALWHDREEARFVENENESNFSITSWLSLNKDTRNYTGLSNKFGGKYRTINEQDYLVLASKHSLFTNIETNSIPIEGKQFTGMFCEWNSSDSIPVPASSLFSSNLLAYNICLGEARQINAGGIYSVQPDSLSGKIISLGTEDWCLQKNQEKKEIFEITKNAVHLLVK